MQTVITGVYLNKIKTFYTAKICINHKQKSKNFNIKKYGQQEALNRAIKQRQKWEKEIIQLKERDIQNNYIINNNIVTLEIISDNYKKEVYFDKKHLEKIKQHHWCLDNYNNGKTYAMTYIKSKQILLYNLLFNFKNNHKITFLDRNPANCLEENIKCTTKSIQSINKNKMITNKSGRTGVCLDAPRNRFLAYIKINGKSKRKHFNITSYINKEEAFNLAVQQREQWEDELGLNLNNNKKREI